MGKLVLSSLKLNKLLTKYNYVLVSFYVDDNGSCKFIECRTPTKQKTFMIYIPSKFNMIIKDESVNSVKIKNVDNATQKQTDYLINSKGPMLDIDIIYVSSKSV